MSFLAKNYNRRKISFKYGKGSFLYSTNGKKYLLVYPIISLKIILMSFQFLMPTIIIQLIAIF